MASDKRTQVTLECQECKRRNYIPYQVQGEHTRAHRAKEILPLVP
ncbi:MAG: hypothetical protein Ct9H300mP31_02050 [Acidimicrobiaceae bacterium]|nr:MAG: hypothetical protein Ct9H300mP31_02050 [Acidimicrobiaceae bacterium]